MTKKESTPLELRVTELDDGEPTKKSILYKGIVEIDGTPYNFTVESKTQIRFNRTHGDIEFKRNIYSIQEKTIQVENSQYNGTLQKEMDTLFYRHWIIDCNPVD